MAQVAEVKNKVIWAKKDDRWLLYEPFSLQKDLLYLAHGDLLTGHDGV
jgi:hypothetical protein